MCSLLIYPQYDKHLPLCILVQMLVTQYSFVCHSSVLTWKVSFEDDAYKIQQYNAIGSLCL